MTHIRVAIGLVVVAALVWCAVGVAAGAQPAGHGAETERTERAGGHGSGDTNPLEFKADLAIWTAVVFLVLLLILWKFAWGPLAQGLDRREQGIAEQIAQAERSNQQAQQLLGQYEQKLGDAKGEVHAIVEQGRRDAEQVGREMIENAKQDAKREQQRALQQIDTATANALKELADQSATMAVELAGKIVRAELKPDDHAHLIEQAAAKLVRQSPSEN